MRQHPFNSALSDQWFPARILKKGEIQFFEKYPDPAKMELKALLHLGELSLSVEVQPCRTQA
jgi:hypothetical protein